MFHEFVTNNITDFPHTNSISKDLNQSGLCTIEENENGGR